MQHNRLSLLWGTSSRNFDSQQHPRAWTSRSEGKAWEHVGTISR